MTLSHQTKANVPRGSHPHILGDKGHKYASILGKGVCITSTKALFCNYVDNLQIKEVLSKFQFCGSNPFHSALNSWELG